MYCRYTWEEHLEKQERSSMQRRASCYLATTSTSGMETMKSG